MLPPAARRRPGDTATVMASRPRMVTAAASPAEVRERLREMIRRMEARPSRASRRLDATRGVEDERLPPEAAEVVPTVPARWANLETFRPRPWAVSDV